MSRDSNGTMTNPISAFVASALIKAADFNTLISDIITELTNSIDKGGRTTPTANLPMGGFKHTGAAAASGSGQYMEYAQVNTALALKADSTAVALKADIASPNFTGTATVDKLNTSKTVIAAGTTGAQTINKTSGSVNFAAAAASLVVTNSYVATTSIIHCTVGTNDATMKSCQAVAASGSFTIYPDANPTAETRVNFLVTN
jgi:hypothetical protein